MTTQTTVPGFTAADLIRSLERMDPTTPIRNLDGTPLRIVAGSGTLLFRATDDPGEGFA